MQPWPSANPALSALAELRMLSAVLMANEFLTFPPPEIQAIGRLIGHCVADLASAVASDRPSVLLSDVPPESSARTG